MLSKRLLLKNHRELENSVETIIRLFEKIFEMTNLLNADKELIAEGSLLRACALWEKFLEKEIVYLVYLNPDKMKTAVDLSKDVRLNTKLIRAIIFSNNYRDFNDVQKAKGQFKTFVDDKYNLLSKVRPELLTILRFVFKIRNYLAHHSDYSKKKLFEHYKKKYDYTNFIEPGKFLIKNKGSNFKELVHNFSRISASMRRYLT